MNRNLFLIVSILLATIAFLLGNMVAIGNNLKEIHSFCMWMFYVLFLLPISYLAYLIVKVHRAPEVPVLAVDSTGNAKLLREFAMRLAANCDYISDKEVCNKHRRMLLNNIQFYSAEEDSLRSIISEEIDKRIKGSKELNVLGIDNRIKEWGKTVFMVTAISQNNKFDTLAVLVMNYNLIADIVLASGFRPTKPQMFKLYVKVLTTALVTYCTSQVFTDVKGVAPFDIDNGNAAEEITQSIDSNVDVDLDEGDFGASIMSSLKKLEIPGALLGSVMDGCLNALMTLRIGYITKAYLTKGAAALSGTKNKRYIKREAIKESFSAMPSIIVDGGNAIGKTASSILAGVFQMKKNDIYNSKESELNESDQQS